MPYVDLDRLLPDGTWSRNDAHAVSWVNKREAMIDMGALVTRLREEAAARADPRHREIIGVLLAPRRPRLLVRAAACRHR